MGDIFGALQSVVKILTPLATTELMLIYDLQGDITAIRDELQSMSEFLKNAEEHAEGDNAIRNWVREVRILAYDIEDVIERYQLLQKETTFVKVKKYLYFEKTRISHDIKSFRERAITIANRKEYYKLKEDSAIVKARITTTSFLSSNKEDELVGAEMQKRKIIEFIGLERLNTTPSTVVAVGMTGLGKTTVISTVFNDATVRSYFPISIWISVSQRKEHVDILRTMMAQYVEATPTEGQNINEILSIEKNTLFRRLQKILKTKRYLVVFDDVQESEIKLAEYIKQRLLPVNHNGSKVLITTRYENVASTWLDGSNDVMYKFKPLPYEKAWELFCRKTFKGSCPPHLEKIAPEIVQKCGGLPPAIMSVGSLLSSQTSDMNEWEKVCRSLGVYLDENRHMELFHQILMQNYHDLPFHLKPCFLYFGLFPKGYLIERMRLIRLWIAEGFIEIKGNLTLEEVAEEYLSQLMNMSLIEAKVIDPTGKVRIVGVVSDFLHEIIYPKFKELRFCKILSKSDSIGDESSRRLYVHANDDKEEDDDDDDNNKNNYANTLRKCLDNISKTKSNLRSLFLPEVTLRIGDRVFNNAFLSSISLLKVLDLCNAAIYIIPNEIEKLLNLQYLSLRCTRVSVLPSTIGKLQNLQTLDLKQTFVTELPLEITQLFRLRHLLGYSYSYDFSFSSHSLRIDAVRIPEGALGQCVEMQKLAYLDLGVEHKTWVTELKNLKELRKLGVIGLKSGDGKDLCSIIEEMKHLQSFSVFSKDKSETIDLHDVRSPPLMLQHIYLSGTLASFPTWIYDLQNLVKLHLRWSNLEVDPFENLQLLPNLVELQLLEGYLGDTLQIESKGFQKLKILYLLDLRDLRSLCISEGSLPLLEEMSVGESENLEVPYGIKYLSILKTLNFYNMPSHFLRLLLPYVKHVPNVLYYNKHPQGYKWQTYTIS